MNRPHQKFYEQAEQMHSLVWEICYRLRIEKCKNCPHIFHDERFGLCHHGCRLMAEETIAVVLEAVAIENIDLPALLK